MPLSHIIYFDIEKNSQNVRTLIQVQRQQQYELNEHGSWISQKQWNLSLV